MRISLPIIIQVRSGVCAPSSLTGHQYDFTLSYPVNMKPNFINIAHFVKEILHSKSKDAVLELENILLLPMRPAIDWPEEHPYSSTAGSSVGGASSHVFPIQLAETAGALRAQHGPAKQAQGRMLPLIVCGLGTPEDDRGVGLTSLAHFPLNGGDWKDCKCPPYWKWLAWLRRAL